MKNNNFHFNKYHAKKVTVDGETYDSKKEYKRFLELKKLETAGEIKNLRRQVKFELLPAQYSSQQVISAKTGKDLKPKIKCLERAVYYIADFVYEDKKGKQIVEDTKGQRTKDYILKRKMMLYLKKIIIKEVWKMKILGYLFVAMGLMGAVLCVPFVFLTVMAFCNACKK